MAKNQNSNLHSAKKQKNDEFYTQLSDIEREMQHYKQHFLGKTIYCNCDDPEWSNFFKYFALNFEHLRLKKLVSTHFVYSDMFVEGETYKLEIVKGLDLNEDGKIDLADVVKTTLKGNGDFRSTECIEILKQADIVVTNPPFSLFREYVVQLVDYEKKFLIIGNRNAITYKEVFRLIKEGKMWLGHEFYRGNAYFEVPEDYANTQLIILNGRRLVKSRNCCWFTNMDYKERHENIILYKKYNEKDYPKYDNYDAIEVSKVADIPIDYDGNMGVPVTFMDKYNPEQFELVGMGEDNGTGFSGGAWLGGSKSCLVNGKAAFKRLFIRKKRII
ncbi:MAG: adenine-specific methyltransferase EcoRI family protein [Bacteroidales bacterium]|jgi:hypothetical protein|nr:adenine-specific methyltransferase EcoRI family protein [Bacteroidales bacterium]